LARTSHSIRGFRRTLEEDLGWVRATGETRRTLEEDLGWVRATSETRRTLEEDLGWVRATGETRRTLEEDLGWVRMALTREGISSFCSVTRGGTSKSSAVPSTMAAVCGRSPSPIQRA